MNTNAQMTLNELNEKTNGNWIRNVQSSTVGQQGDDQKPPKNTPEKTQKAEKNEENDEYDDEYGDEDIQIKMFEGKSSKAYEELENEKNENEKNQKKSKKNQKNQKKSKKNSKKSKKNLKKILIDDEAEDEDDEISDSLSLNEKENEYEEEEELDDIESASAALQQHRELQKIQGMAALQARILKPVDPLDKSEAERIAEESYVGSMINNNKPSIYNESEFDDPLDKALKKLKNKK